jgi:histidinol-phosphate aminotransferase
MSSTVKNAMFADRLVRLTPYTAGEQPQDRKYIKLNTNENPYPPSPRIWPFLDKFDPDLLRLYPDPLFFRLREAIAERHGCAADRVFVGNGSDELLSFVFFAFFDSARGPLLFPEFTYSFYPVYSDFYGIGYEKVGLESDFSISVDRYLDREKSCGIIFPNPNAPTGIYTPVAQIERLLSRYPQDRVVVIDEAYIDFGGESAARLLDGHKNLLIIRTFSKSYSLAGLRLGFALGHPDLVQALFTVKDSFNSYTLDALAQRIAEVAVRDAGYYSGINAKVCATRDRFCAGLTDIGFQALPSRANFVFARKPGVPGRDIYRRLKEEGILVRHFNKPGIDDFVRITIGLPEEMDILLEKLKGL